MLPAEAGRDTRNTKTMVRNHYHSTIVAHRDYRDLVQDRVCLRSA
jgi:hypothetical protein